MLQDIVTKGSTDRSVTVKILDSTDGTPETGVVFNTAGIALWYRREGGALVAITEATLAALTTAHADGGFLHVSDGIYRLDLPDAAFATAANYVDYGGTVTGMVVIGGRVRLVDYSLEDAVRMGLTALPNAAAEAAGGLYTRGTGAGQINQPANGMVDGNMVRISGDSAAADNLETSFDDSSGTVPWMNIIDQDTAQSATGTTIVLRAGASFANSEIIGARVTIVGGTTGLGQSRTITGYVSSTDTATVDAWTTTPTGTILYKIYGAAPAPTTAPAANVTHFGGTAGTFAAGRPEVNTSHVGGTLQTAGDIMADTNDIQSRLPVALVGGRMDSSVGAMAASVLTATAINADAFTAAKFAADVTTELQSGLATSAALSTMQGNVTDILADTAVIGAAGAGLTAVPWNAAWDAEVQSECADAITAAGLATAGALATVDGIVDALLVTSDKLDDTLEITSDATYIFTADALALAPSGGGSPPTVGQIADAVWDEVLSGHAGVGSAGAALSAAGSAGDPWSTPLPGAYGAGTAGNIIGVSIDATVSSRASAANLAVVDGIVDDILLDTAVIGALGAGLTAVPWNAAWDAEVQSECADAITAAALATAANLATVAGYLDTEIAAILADTNELQTDWVDGGRLDLILDARASQTSVDDVPTNAELATALGTADDAVMARLGAPVGASISADIAAVKADTAAVLVDTGTDGVVVATASKTGYRLSATGVDDVLDEVVDGATTLRESVRLANSALGGKASGMGTTEVTFRDLADTKDRVVATVDGVDGNRTAITRDLT